MKESNRDSFIAALKRQMYEASAECDIPMMSDETVSDLLAWLYVLGGGREASTQCETLVCDIKEAQRKANLYGGETPNLKYKDEVKRKSQVLEAWEKKENRKDNLPDILLRLRIYVGDKVFAMMI